MEQNIRLRNRPTRIQSTDFCNPGIESVSPALAGGFLTTAPPGKLLMLLTMLYLAFLWKPNKDSGLSFCLSLSSAS